MNALIKPVLRQPLTPYTNIGDFLTDLSREMQAELCLLEARRSQATGNVANDDDDEPFLTHLTPGSTRFTPTSSLEAQLF